MLSACEVDYRLLVLLEPRLLQGQRPSGRFSQAREGAPASTGTGVCGQNPRRLKETATPGRAGRPHSSFNFPEFITLKERTQEAGKNQEDWAAGGAEGQKLMT